MTIKQQGGIFGRNPTFNDVTVDGDLVVDGAVTVPNDSISGDAIDGGTPTPAALVIQSASSPIQLNDAAGVRRWLIQKGADDLFFYRYNTGGGYAGNPLTINSTTGLSTFEGNIKMKTAGNGIDFSATAGTGTSELFDDYEQGTFSPVVKGTTSNPSVTSGTAYGRYTKIGNRVFGNVYMRQVWSSAGSGTLYVDGFPYVMFENQFPGISFGLTDLVGTISNGYLTTVYGTSGCAAVLTGASGVTGSNKYITFTFQYVTGEN
jgi:hypothetical protein